MRSRRPRLRRLDRVYSDSPIYFVTAGTYGRKELLHNADLCQAFVAFCEKGKDRGIFVGRFVLMPDHFHVFVQFGPEFMETVVQRRSDRVAAVCDRRSNPDCLSVWMKSLKNTLSIALRQKGVSAPHWQKGFFDHVLRSGESYSEKWQYVLENPVRTGLVDDWKKWDWQGEVCSLEG
jgi:putative transposase